MISAAGQQKLQSLVQAQGRGGLEQLIKNKDLDGLKNAGLTEIDARAVLAQAQQSGLDGLMNFLSLQGGAQNQTAGGQLGVSQMAGKTGGGGAQLGTVRGGTGLDGVDLNKVKEFNLKGLTLPKEITKIADETFAGRHTRIATAGYSAPPGGTAYAEHTAQFLGSLADKLGTGNVGFISSPTADKGSIDAITTTMGQEKKVPTLNITAKGYVDYIDPSKFPESIDKTQYTATPKYVFPDGAKYNQATALASNAFIATGGRDVTVFDFMRAVEKGNPVVLIVDESMKKAMGETAIWDGGKSRPNNGAAYLAEQLASFAQTGQLKHPVVAKDGMGSFDASWLKDNAAKLSQLVKVVNISGPSDIDAAAGAAAQHLSSFTAVLDGVDQSKIKEFNLKGLALPQEISKIADETFAGRSTRIATAGYSAPPGGTSYAEHTAEFLGALADRIGTKSVGFITSPTADKGSIDAITQTMGQSKKVPTLNITAKGYIDYIDPSKFPESLDKAQYKDAPKYVFPDGAKYNQATALASNAFVATGGRDVTVFDFMRAVEKGNPVVLVVDESMKKAMGDTAIWDGGKNRPNNGAAYLAEQLASFAQTGQLKHPVVAKDGMGSFDAAWLKDNAQMVSQLVKVVTIGGPNDIGTAAAAAAAHLTGK